MQRWLKFVKYLREFQWEPVVYAPRKTDILVQDPTLERDIPENLEVIRRPIWEPYRLYHKMLGKPEKEVVGLGGFTSETGGGGFLQKLSVFIRGNFFIPDARKFWIRPSCRFLKKYLAGNPVDLMVTNGPPHSLHLTGLRLKRSLNIPWIADFRDPWTRIYYFDQLKLTRWVEKKHRKLEKEVLSSADCITTVGNTIKKEFEELGASRAKVITNGYDPEDTDDVMPEPTGKFTITHTGNISSSKNPDIFWKAVSELLNEHAGLRDRLRIVLTGTLDHSVTKSIRQYKLEDYVRSTGYLAHPEIIKYQKSASVLLLVISDSPSAKGVLTGKLFEYLAAGRPILAIAPEDSDLAEIIGETGSGRTTGFDDVRQLKANILHYFDAYLHGRLRTEPKNIQRFSRKNLTAEMVKVFEETTGETNA